MDEVSIQERSTVLHTALLDLELGAGDPLVDEREAEVPVADPLSLAVLGEPNLKSRLALRRVGIARWTMLWNVGFSNDTRVGDCY